MKIVILDGYTLNPGDLSWDGLRTIGDVAIYDRTPLDKIIEPPAKDNPLFSAKNCIITPHIAWATKEARTRLMDMAIHNLIAFINGQPVNVVN